MTSVARLLLIAAVLGLLDGGVAGARERWHPPLPGATLVGGFTFQRAAPYAGGQRRGVDLRGVPGARVVAACAGVVTYVGRVPRWGRGVSVRCGGLVATELGLASASVARGSRVWPGAVVGRLAPGGVLRLGARRVGVVHGYVDPLGLLGRGDGWAPPSVAPRGAPALRPRPRAAPPTSGLLPAHHRVVPPLRAVRHAVPAANARPATVTEARPTALPRPVWAGLALLAVGAGGGGVVRRRGPRRRRTGMALAQR